MASGNLSKYSMLYWSYPSKMRLNHYTHIRMAKIQNSHDTVLVSSRKSHLLVGEPRMGYLFWKRV